MLTWQSLYRWDNCLVLLFVWARPSAVCFGLQFYIAGYCGIRPFLLFLFGDLAVVLFWALFSGLRLYSSCGF